MLEGSEWSDGRKKMKSMMGEPATLKNGNPQNQKKPKMKRKKQKSEERELGSQKRSGGGGAGQFGKPREKMGKVS